MLLQTARGAIVAAWLLWLRCVATPPKGPPDGLPGRRGANPVHCPFTRRVVCGYEYFSTSSSGTPDLCLDIAVGDGNKVAVVAWMFATAVWSGVSAVLTFMWSHAGAGGASPPLVPTAEERTALLLFMVAGRRAEQD
eukprot:gene40479-3015_t